MKPAPKVDQNATLGAKPLLGNKKRRCSKCKYEFTPHRLPLYLTRDQWREIIRWFLVEQSSQNISIRTSLERRRVMRALTVVGRVLTKDVPGIFSGTVEVDETYLGGQWKNKRRSVRDQGSKRGRGTKKQPVFGILCRNGTCRVPQLISVLLTEFMSTFEIFSVFVEIDFVVVD